MWYTHVDTTTLAFVIQGPTNLGEQGPYISWWFFVVKQYDFSMTELLYTSVHIIATLWCNLALLVDWLIIMIHDIYDIPGSLRQCHGCWCPGPMRRQATSNQSIDFVEKSVPCRHLRKKSTICTVSVYRYCIMMTSSNGNIFHVTGPLCEEFTAHRWVPIKKASDAELSFFLWSTPEYTVE